MRRGLVWWQIVGLVAMVTAGCGGDDDRAPGGPSDGVGGTSGGSGQAGAGGSVGGAGGSAAGAAGTTAAGASGASGSGAAGGGAGGESAGQSGSSGQSGTAGGTAGAAGEGGAAGAAGAGQAGGGGAGGPQGSLDGVCGDLKDCCDHLNDTTNQGTCLQQWQYTGDSPDQCQGILNSWKASPGCGLTATGSLQVKGTIGAAAAHSFTCKGGDANGSFSWNPPVASISCSETTGSGQSFSLQTLVQTGTWTSASSDLLLTFGDSASTFTGSASSVTAFEVKVTTADVNAKHLVGAAKATWKADGSTPSGGVEATFDVTFP